jgi:hypothetical protein
MIWLKQIPSLFQFIRLFLLALMQYLAMQFDLSETLLLTESEQVSEVLFHLSSSSLESFTVAPT